MRRRFPTFSVRPCALLLPVAAGQVRKVCRVLAEFRVRVTSLAVLLVLIATVLYSTVVHALDQSASSVTTRTVAAREFGLTGTVDCGLRSGQRCQLGSSLMMAVWTDDISGTRERVMVDVSWIVSQLDAYDQDDLVYLTVQTADDGHLQAVGVSNERSAPKPTKRPADDDERKSTDAATATPTPTGTQLPTQTATPSTIPSATIAVTAAATLDLTPTATATATAIATTTSTATVTSTATSTSTPAPVINLSLTKTGRVVTCTDGGCITEWTITVTNVGPASAHNVVVIDRPATELKGVDTAVVRQGTFDKATKQWTVGTVGVGLANQQTAVIRFFPSNSNEETRGWTNEAEVESVDEKDANSIPNNHDPAEDDQDSDFVTLPR
jgi:uncharacterized repeat protein (TIGR01451 family)